MKRTISKRQHRSDFDSLKNSKGTPYKQPSFKELVKLGKSNPDEVRINKNRVKKLRNK